MEIPVQHAARLVVLGWSILLLGAGLAELEAGGREAPAELLLRAESFDHDPAWECFGNRVQPARSRMVRQDFGYAAGKGTGSAGGRITRSSKPAYYAADVGVKTLKDKLTASGTFRLTATAPGSGVFFGWFNAQQPGGGGRPMNSLGLNLDGERGGARLAVRLIGGGNKSCGTFITPFVPGKFRPTPVRNDGTPYRWRLAYDPDANGGGGRFMFSIRSDRGDPEEFEGREFSVDLPEGFKQEGGTFNRFGLMNMMKAGGEMTIYVDTLDHDGKTEDFRKDPGWIGSGNRDSYEDPDLVGAHDFGFSPGTAFAGGSPGELGGKFWRSGNFAYYADRVGSLTLSNRLEASGRVVLLVGAPDSDMYLGWFNRAAKDTPPAERRNFLGIHVGGPTRVGHYFQPSYATQTASRRAAQDAPVLKPQKVYEWSLVYDPTAGGGKGAITVKLGSEVVTLPLKPGHKSEGANFDRFGVFTSAIGGQMVRAYFDDLKYTAARAGR